MANQKSKKPMFIQTEEVMNKWSEKIRLYHEALSRLLSEEELPLVATICSTIYLHENKVVPTESIKVTLVELELPFAVYNQFGKELTEREVIKRWQLKAA